MRQLYLPAYPPDFNPTEKTYSKLDAHLRKAAVHTVDDLWQAIAARLDLFTPNECTNHLISA